MHMAEQNSAAAPDLEPILLGEVRGRGRDLSAGLETEESNPTLGRQTLCEFRRAIALP